LALAWQVLLVKRAATHSAVAKLRGAALSVAMTSREGPPAAAVVTAWQLADHRLAFLDYEGPLSGDRGTVNCCERGTYTPLTAGDNGLAVLLSGNALQGKVELVRQGPTWTLAVAGA